MSFHKNLRGSDLHAPTNELVENNTAGILTALTVVKFNGYGSVFPQVEKQSLADDPVCGVVQADIAVGGAGYVTSLGLLISVNTNAWTVNTILYGSATGALSTTPFGPSVAIVMRQDAVNGVLYVFNTLGQVDANDTMDWHVVGNFGLNPDPTVGNFLGTTDAKALRVRTDNVHRMTVDENGRFGFGQEATTPPAFIYEKAHTGYDGSGRRRETYAVTTSNGSMNNAYALTVPAASTALVTITAVGRQQDAAAHCGFKRTVCVYLEGMQVVIQGGASGVQSDFTQGGPGFNVGFTISGNQLQFNVQNLSGGVTNWSGTVEVDVIS